MNTPLTDSPATDEALARRRAAIAALGHELRDLVDAAVRTTAADETLHQALDDVRRLTAELTVGQRAPAEISPVDEFPGGLRMYSPVTGQGSPLAPPMEVVADDACLVGRCVLGSAHEGPPGFAHGGMSAMLLDELMGHACAAAGTPAMTISLRLRYQGPVPLATPLRVVARVVRTEGRKLHVDGSIATETAPASALVAADAVFVAPDPARFHELFPCLPATP
ncbi:PaaI family thioesterase [Streptomyces sp. 8K308]|uniref:PaaI family thioesterase n=1 Tax=Streptomyces sp. 8K308 TaxID=2530388 RepID=UPI00104DD849|nr:PaaI family thioesterase [Streptomyces sp. 8K308]TDC27742.1 PaaI family thioesterase [Streptomyces sp. 8K308]